MKRSDTKGQDVRDQCRRVEAALAALPRWQREALVQRRYHGLSYAEIAATLHCSEEGARASVYAALGALRDGLGETACAGRSRDQLSHRWPDHTPRPEVVDAGGASGWPIPASAEPTTHPVAARLGAGTGVAGVAGVKEGVVDG